MIRISITVAAFEAIAATLPGSVLFERERDDQGEREVDCRENGRQQA